MPDLPPYVEAREHLPVRAAAGVGERLPRRR